MFTRSELDSVESESRHAIERMLGPLLELADETRLLLFEAAEAVSQHPLSGPETFAASKVCMILAARLANDLRACSILARHGYGLQAMGLAATSVELAGTLAYVGNNEERAHEWAKHSAKKQSYPGRVKDGIDALADALGITGTKSVEMTERWQSIYMALCMAKHGNPILSMKQGMRFDSEGAYFGAGPDASRLGVRLSYIALYQATLFSLEGSFVSFQSCNDDAQRMTLQEHAKEIAYRVEGEYQRLSDFMVPSPLDDE